MCCSVYSDPPYSDGGMVRRIRLGTGIVQPNGDVEIELHALPANGRILIEGLFEPEQDRR
jgi:hypothetical protein